jgi:hypothetical protein
MPPVFFLNSAHGFCFAFRPVSMQSFIAQLPVTAPMTLLSHTMKLSLLSPHKYLAT